jgi:hypothetical protein
VLNVEHENLVRACSSKEDQWHTHTMDVFVDIDRAERMWTYENENVRFVDRIDCQLLSMRHV